MASNYDKIKEAADLTRRAAQLKYSQGQVTDPSFDISRLNGLFLEFIDARNNSFTNFDALFKKRLQIFENAITGYCLSFFNNALNINGKKVVGLFSMLDIVGTEEFLSNFDQLTYIKDNNLSFEVLDRLSLYFDIKFNEIKNVAYPDSKIEFFVDQGLKINDVLKTKEELEDNKIYNILYILGLLKNASNPLLLNEISSYKGYFVGQSGSFTEIVKEKIGEYMSVINNATKSAIYLENFRRERDKNYNNDYAQEILENFSKVDTNLKLFSDLSATNLELVKKSGIYEQFFNTIKDIDSQVNSLMSDIIISVDTIDSFLENYSIFVKLPVDEAEKLRQSIIIAEGAGSSISLYTQTADFSVYYDPFREGDRFLGYVNWAFNITQDKKINGGIYSLLLLYLGLRMKKLNPVISESYVKYVLLDLIKKNLVKESFINDNFIRIKRLERQLLLERGIRVVENPEDGVISFSIKSLMPDLEILDYMSLSEIFYFGSTNQSLSDMEVSLRRHIRVFILESILKNKNNLNETILRIIEIVREMPKENLKSIYFELCIRQTMDLLVTYLENVVGVSNIDSQSTISDSTRLVLKAFKSTAIEQQIEQVLKDYVEVWNAFYSPSTDLIDFALKNGTTLKNELTSI
jgi:hypothetical protein